ncbi:hypothetical protein NDU88_006001 [Pleurodeles waltl]|uniref:Uncharacterized protein n=1 Tax=Pleurodeles waltl TaxID=8319 RepID=A0AAV7LN08_PLEWA|nr:hypothetical protein NDU88_006001 [Pleurodeles waltl]
MAFTCSRCPGRDFPRHSDPKDPLLQDPAQPLDRKPSLQCGRRKVNKDRSIVVMNFTDYNDYDVEAKKQLKVSSYYEMVSKGRGQEENKLLQDKIN